MPFMSAFLTTFGMNVKTLPSGDLYHGVGQLLAWKSVAVRATGRSFQSAFLAQEMLTLD